VSATADEPLRVGFLGRVPPPLGGAGLELQMARSAEALERLGHEVVWVDAGGPDARFDVLHAFGSEPAVWHQLSHWSRNRVPLVVTAVVVVAPGREERLMRLSARIPGMMTSSRMRADLLRRADTVIAGSEYERGLVTRLGADPARVVVRANGVDPVAPGALPEGVPERPFALMVGAVSRRKRQADVLRALAGGEIPVVVAGPHAGDPGELSEWERTVAATGAAWVGSIDSGALAALRERALALVHPSAAETQSLAVGEALAQPLPCVLSDIPVHRELREAHPGWVVLVRAPGEVAGALERLRSEPPREPAPRIPGWDDVARELVELYRGLLGDAR
jgi:glycosyltransferase involved in cell wall biosynthesis